MFVNMSVSSCKIPEELTELDKFLHVYIRSLLSSLFLSKREEEVSSPFFFESFHSFRKSVWKQQFARLTRDELCEVSMPSFCGGEVVDRVREDWKEELKCAWENMIVQWPTFVLYFREGVKFSIDSFQAFFGALENLEEKEIEKGSIPRVSLFLGNNGIGDREAFVLAQAIRSLKTLVHLDLKDNVINSAGVEVLAEAIKYSMTLKLLDLSGNPVGEEGGKTLAKALEINRSLEYLSLSTENVSSDAAKAFERVCVHNKAIELDIWR